jgi:hypothetical protein
MIFVVELRLRCRVRVRCRALVIAADRSALPGSDQGLTQEEEEETEGSLKQRGSEFALRTGCAPFLRCHFGFTIAQPVEITENRGSVVLTGPARSLESKTIEAPMLEAERRYFSLLLTRAPGSQTRPFDLKPHLAVSPVSTQV